jgi:salicylate hydroxylase
MLVRPATPLTVAVVGAGIGGLTLAAALSRTGVRCEVFEQARCLSEVGAGIQIAPNAARLLHRLGLERRLRACAVRPRAIEMRRWSDDAPLASTVLGDECERLYGAPYYTIHRAHLHEALVGLLTDNVLHLGRRVIGVADLPDRAVLRFDDGAVYAADVVVGADGIHSVVREALVADAPVFSGQTIYRGLLPRERAPLLAGDPAVRLWLGPGQHCVCYPVSGGQAVSFAATCPAAGWSTESWSAIGDPDALADAYRGWNRAVVDLVRAAGTVRRWALHDRVKLTRWSSARLTLLGDAAHPMLPFMAQGANQAIEDALTLAACLTLTTSPRVPEELRRYEALRAPRTELVQRRSRDSAGALHLPDGPAQAERDAGLPGFLDLRGQEWLYGYDAERSAHSSTRRAE